MVPLAPWENPEEPEPAVLALMAMVPLSLAPPRAALTTTAPAAAERGSAPLAVLVAPPMFNVPEVELVRPIAPAPVAVAVNVAPLYDVTNTPPLPAVAMIVPATSMIFVSAVPIPLVPPLGVVSTTVPPRPPPR